MNPAYTSPTSDFLRELEVVASSADTAEGYRRLAAFLSRFLLEATQQANVSLVGPYAKVDYLLKKHHADTRTRMQINTARVHLRETEDELACGLNAALALSPDAFQRDLAGIRLLVELCESGGKQTSKPTSQQPDEAADTFHSSLFTSRSDTYQRLLVTAVDDTHLHGTTPEGRTLSVPFPQPDDPTLFGTPREAYEYIQPGCQVNIVDRNIIVFEPDYLIDISSLANSVAEYGDAPDTYLLRKLAPSEATEHTLLGNLSGQLLDEQLHSPDTTYAESVRHFMRYHAMDLLTTSFQAKDFHASAQQQRANIQAVLDVDLPQAVPGYRRDDIIVEPSFFCEMLGVQGRMDFLQADMRLLIEQKSGKGAFVPYDPTPDIPKIQQPHYVQLLLYMALLRYNFPEAYHANNDELYAYLMYSRYRNALQGKGFAPQLLRRAIRLRNRIVAQEMRCARQGFGHLLHLTADDLNEWGVKTTLWRQFQRPQIEHTLDALRQASPLEQAYVLRFLQFVAREQLHDKLGNQQKEASGFASTWHSSLEEKMEAGNIMIVEAPPRPSPVGEGDISSPLHACVENVTFLTQGTNVTNITPSPTGEGRGGAQGWGGAQGRGGATAASNFRPGDVVFFYPFRRGTVPDARRTMVFRASVQAMHPDRIELRLRAPQADARVFDRYGDHLWAIEHDHLESSSTGQFRSVYAFLSAPKERRDLLLLQRPPHVDDTLTLKGEYGSFNEMQLRVKQARDLFLIIGPPGTGKTSFGMLYTLKEQLLEADSRVLILSYTNRAVDEVCSKLVEEGIPFLRMGNEYSCAPEYKAYLWNERAEACGTLEELRQLLMAQRVIVGTSATLTSHASLFNIMDFDLAIIDEASQILEPHLLGLLSAQHEGRAAIRKFVMIGDHKQLPAVVQQTERDSHVEDASLRAIGLTDCAHSLFERLLRRYRQDPSVTFMLTRQGRMHPLIADFPNKMFYEGRLSAVGLPHQKAELPASPEGEDPSLEELLRTRRVVFLPVKRPEQSHSDKVNTAEADLICQIVRHIYDIERSLPEGEGQPSIGIIVPYRNQISAIRSRLATLGIAGVEGIAIDTVERFQGSQRRYIIYGFTVQQPYQLRFLTSQSFMEDDALIDRKLNVVMTRAQEHLIMLGNPELLRRIPHFARLIEAYAVPRNA